MHIAICDDNVADRKQLERLLHRESDKRIPESGNLYIDSYGNPQTLLKNPMQYDAFFIDICKTEGINGIDVVNSLTTLGSQSLIILCSSDIDYSKYPLPSRVICLNKPIKAEILSELLDEARKMKDSSAPLIELREDKGTYYVEEHDILYAREENRLLIITLADGRTVRSGMTAMNFLSQLESFPSFFSPTIRSVINGHHITNIRFTKITMTDGTCFHALGWPLFYARKIWKEKKADK